MIVKNLVNVWESENPKYYEYSKIEIIKSIFSFFDIHIFNKKLTDILQEKKLHLNIAVISLRLFNQKIIKSEDIILYLVNEDFFDKQTIKDIFIMVEYFIIDLVIVVFRDLLSLDVYVHINNLRRCLLKNIFNITSIHPQLTIKYEEKNANIDVENLFKMHLDGEVGLPINISNSCYIDSLIFVLLVGDDKYIKDILFNTNVFEDVAIKESFRNPRLSEYIHTKEEFARYSNIIQKQLIYNFAKIIIGKEDYYCKNIRDVLFLINPSLKNKYGHYETYTPGEIYSDLSVIFPKLNVDVPTNIFNEIKDKKYNMFLMYDFITPEKSDSEILWEHINSNFLVFQLGVYPKIDNYGYSELKDKVSFINYDKNGVMGIRSEYIIKKRFFAEYILGKYRLFGAVCNEGRVSTNTKYSGGSHYTAYVRPFFDKEEWYYYNDLGPTFRKIGNIPKDIFLDSDLKRSEMLFYSKIEK